MEAAWCCAGWVLGNMIPFWYVLKFAGLLRATADEEALGLDSSHHGGSAYTGTADDDKSHNATNGAVSKVCQLPTSPGLCVLICSACSRQSYCQSMSSQLHSVTARYCVPAPLTLDICNPVMRCGCAGGTHVQGMCRQLLCLFAERVGRAEGGDCCPEGCSEGLGPLLQGHCQEKFSD
jgi:hypothetical protein